MNAADLRDLTEKANQLNAARKKRWCKREGKCKYWANVLILRW
jgi:hypothetical protein